MAAPYVATRDDPRKMRYIEWLTTPKDMREPKTERELAKELDIYVKTLYNWRHDREFRDVWRDSTDEIVGGEDKRQQVIDSLFKVAVDRFHPRQVAAAKLYTDLIREISPPREGDFAIGGSSGKVPVDMLTDEELDALIKRGVEAG